MNENDVLFQKVTQAKKQNKTKKNKKESDTGILGKIFFPSMPVSLSGIIHHSNSLFFHIFGSYFLLSQFKNMLMHTLSPW